LLEIKEEELWVGGGYFSNEGETKGRSDFMSHKILLQSLKFSKKEEREKLLGRKGQF